MSQPALVEHFFRHQYGKLVATLSRRVGLEHIEAVEDAVQAALMCALESWPRRGQPEDPCAWLFRVANNQLLDDLRRRTRQQRILQGKPAASEAQEQAVEPFLAGQLQDDLLRMLFACCDSAIPVQGQLVMALKTLCGFSTLEIAARLFTSEANVYKRLARARERLRQTPFLLRDLDARELRARLPAVVETLYLLFTEGYLSSDPERAIRRELCDEALRLAELLSLHPVCRVPETCALIALMYLHSARLGARQDAAGGLLLLEEQDRTLWDQRSIETGLRWLAESAEGEHFSRYHAEAGVAAEHCLAARFEETRWERVVECYLLLERLAPSPFHTLNRALATAEWQGPEAGLGVLEDFIAPDWLADSYLLNAVLADLQRRSGRGELARRHCELALARAPSPAVRRLLMRRLAVGVDSEQPA